MNMCSQFGLQYIGYHKESKKGTVIEFVCPEHFDKGVQTKDWSHFRKSKKPCGYCNGRLRDTSEAQKLVKNPNIIFLSEYLGSEKPIKCKCLKCNNEWISNRPIDLFRREDGCPFCSVLKRGRHKTHESFVTDLSLVNPNIDVIGQYTGSHKLIKCKCKKDGYEWESYACNLLNGSAGCPLCNHSVGEKELIEFLNTIGVNHKEQVIFPGCKDIKPLKFDSYDVDNNIAFEFQGEQHYYPVDFSNNDPEEAKKQYEALRKRDEIKKEYCFNNNIKLVCIPYWKRGQIRKYLLNELQLYQEVNNTA